jgi:hypothetical protein
MKKRKKKEEDREEREKLEEASRKHPLLEHHANCCFEISPQNKNSTL